MKKLVLVFYSILVISSSNIFGQNWFPLEIGNRWDFECEVQCPGGYYRSDTVIVEIIADTNFQTDKNYFVLSTDLFGSNYLCNKNDSLYFFNLNDSSNCLIFTFNQSVNSFYYSCKFDSVFFADTAAHTIFGVSDSQQYHGSEFTSNGFSKNFGLITLFYLDGICETYYILKGCVISGVSYGQLLSSSDDFYKPISTFLLWQNFPNPFNPVTTIKFSIPSLGTRLALSVQLKVYDVLGKELATLVNEEKPAGNYEAAFDASNLASGIYYYQLKAGEFVDTKKMILLK